MKTLYISDLDGTLLDANATLSETTLSILNELIDSGVHITCATARTQATASKLLCGVHFPVPAILMNGVAIYDLDQKKYLKIEYLTPNFIHDLIDTQSKYQLTCFLYNIQNNALNTYYERLSNDAMYSFYHERATNYEKQYTKVDSLRQLNHYFIAYALLLDSKEKLTPLVSWLESVRERYGIDFCFYPEIYLKDTWCLEIFSDQASKYNAAQFLRSNYGYDKIIGFGDNLNDLSLFNACDECYAVGNAKTPVKERATAVIGANTEHSVARCIADHVASNNDIDK